MENVRAGGIIQNVNLAQIGVMCVPDRPGIASAVLGALSKKNVNVHFIVQAVDLNDKTHMIMCVAKEDIEVSISAVEEIKSEVQAEKIICRPDVAIVSVFGPHFKDHPGIANMAFSALAEAGINILAISTSISTISCVIDGNCLDKSVEVIRKAFNVPQTAVFTASFGLTVRSSPANQ